MFDMFTPSKRKELRPHQAKAIDLIRHSLGKGNRRVVCQMPTGAGKTITAAQIIEGALAKGNKVIFTAPAVALINQTIGAFEGQGITGIGAMQANHPRTDPLAKVQVASVQTLARREIPEAALVIVDECHIRSEVIEGMMKDRPDVFFVGLSATPWAKGMGLLWQDLVIPCTIGELIEAGLLSQFSAFAPDVPDLSGIKTVAGDYHEGQLAEVMKGRALLASVVETWLAKGQDRPTFCFAVNRAHAADLQEQFNRAGIAAGYCDAFTDSAEMSFLERKFRDGEIRVMCSVRKMTTGVDWPVSCIIDAAPTKSEMLHVQKIGRGLRVNPGTEDCLILDHAGNSLRLGLVTDIHHATLDSTKPGAKQEAKPKAEKLPKECANCAALHVGRVCPYCGNERKPVAGVDTVDGELVELRAGAAPTREEKQRWWSGIRSYQLSRGKSDGWASHTYRDRFGVWPRGLDNRVGSIDRDIQNFITAKAIRWAKSRGAQS